MKLLQLLTLLIGAGTALAASSRRPIKSLHTPKGKESFLSCHSRSRIVDYFNCVAWYLNPSFAETVENYEVVSPVVTYPDGKKVS